MNSLQKYLRIIGLTVSASALSIGTCQAVEDILGYGNPNALVTSNDDVFWTMDKGSHSNRRFSGEIWRSGKGSQPGDEQLLYQEVRTSATSFDSLVHVSVDGMAYLYFVTNYDGAISYIKRLPLDGGTATTLARVPFVANRDLKTDGTFLYWADKDGVRKIPMGGGGITTLVRTQTASQLSLDSQNVYFNSGGSGATLYRVPKNGGTIETIANATSAITDLYIEETQDSSSVVWSEENASVKWLSLATSGHRSIRTVQAPLSGRVATSVGHDGSRILWSDCSSPDRKRCTVKVREAGYTLNIFGNNDVDYNVDAGNIAFDSNRMFWGNDGYVMRYIQKGPLSIAIDPASIRATRSGRGTITRTVNALVANGDGPYYFNWSADYGAFSIHYPQSQSTSIFGALAACDSAEGTLTLSVTDSLGRSAKRDTYIGYFSVRAPGGVCD